MPSLVEQLRRLIQTARVRQAAKLFADSLDATADGDIQDEAALILGELTNLDAERRRGMLEGREFSVQQTRLSYQLLDLAKLAESAQPAISIDAHAPPLKLFISYNHADRVQAINIKQALEAAGYAIHIDAEQMNAGEDISAFIRNSIRATDVTLNIVSNNSLLSGWVAIESLLSFAAEELSGQARFIPCYLDTSFFDPSFRLDVTETIDQRLHELDQLQIKYNEKYLDTTDLNQEQSRLYELRNQLGKILERLKQSLCVDLSPDNFDAGIELLIRSLRTHTRRAEGG